MLAAYLTDLWWWSTRQEQIPFPFSVSGGTPGLGQWPSWWQSTGSRGSSALAGPLLGTHPGIWIHLLKLKSAWKLSNTAIENSSHFLHRVMHNTLADYPCVSFPQTTYISRGGPKPNHWSNTAVSYAHSVPQAQPQPGNMCLLPFSTQWRSQWSTPIIS